MLPVRNGVHDLRRLLPRIARVTERSVDGACETIVVLGRADGEAARIAGAAGARVLVTPRGGYGAFLRAGLAAARGQWVLTMDADFSHQPQFIQTMWRQRRAADLLIGSRYVAGSYAAMPLARRILSRGLNRVYATALSLPYRDLSSAFRLYRRRVLDDIGAPAANGLDALQEIVVRAFSQGWKIAEVPLYYVQPRTWTEGRLADLGASYLQTFGRLFALRNSVKAADYDNRAFDSWIPLQRWWQRARFEVIRSMVDDAERILDIGCGSSRIVQTLPQAVGLDYQIRKLRWLRAPGRQLVQASLGELPFPDASFDAVICSEVIEHIEGDRLDLRDMARVLAPGGTLVLGTPDYSSTAWRVLEGVYKAVFPGGYASEHINPFTRPQLQAEIEGLGLRPVTLRYVGLGHSEMIFKALKAAP